MLEFWVHAAPADGKDEATLLDKGGFPVRLSEKPRIKTDIWRDVDAVWAFCRRALPDCLVTTSMDRITAFPPADSGRVPLVFLRVQLDVAPGNKPGT